MGRPKVLRSPLDEAETGMVQALRAFAQSAAGVLQIVMRVQSHDRPTVTIYAPTFELQDEVSTGTIEIAGRVVTSGFAVDALTSVHVSKTDTRYGDLNEFRTSGRIACVVTGPTGTARDFAIVASCDGASPLFYASKIAFDVALKEAIKRLGKRK